MSKKKKKKPASTSKDGMNGEKPNPSYIADGNAKWYGSSLWLFFLSGDWDQGEIL